MESEDPREKIASEIATASWPELRSHAADDRLFLVGDGLSLLDAGVALANDDSTVVQGWIESNQLTRPTEDQMRAWEAASPEFRFAIVSPYVLAEVVEPES
jgi:hypothetical protein